MIRTSLHYRLIAIGVAMLAAAGGALADEPLQPAEPVRGMTAEARIAQLETMQERVRNMTPEEQRLMRETSVDGRTRLENPQPAQGNGTRRGGRQGGGMGGGQHRQ